MDERRLLRAFLWVSVCPFIFASRCIEALGVRSLVSDIQSCIDTIDAAERIPDKYIDALIVAEDHRSPIHPGIDLISIARAIAARVLWSRIEGASTIEQQFVRVVTGRYDKTIWRKLREQVLALAIVRYRSKRHIAAAYLSIAYYGARYSGLYSLALGCNQTVEHGNSDFVVSAISRLKYPEPSCSNQSWNTKISHRCTYISQRATKSANKPFKSAKSMLSCLLQKAQKPRQHTLAP